MHGFISNDLSFIFRLFPEALQSLVRKACLLFMLWIIYLLNIKIVFCSYLNIMCFQTFLYEGETVGRWTGTEGASDYANHVSCFTDSVGLD